MPVGNPWDRAQPADRQLRRHRRTKRSLRHQGCAVPTREAIPTHGVRLLGSRSELPIARPRTSKRTRLPLLAFCSSARISRSSGSDSEFLRTVEAEAVETIVWIESRHKVEAASIQQRELCCMQIRPAYVSRVSGHEGDAPFSSTWPVWHCTQRLRPVSRASKIVVPNRNCTIAQFHRHVPRPARLDVNIQIEPLYLLSVVGNYDGRFGSRYNIRCPGFLGFQGAPFGAAVSDTHLYASERYLTGVV